MTSHFDPHPTPAWPGQPDQILSASAVAARAATPSRNDGRGLGRPAILATAFIVTFGIGVGIGRVEMPQSDAGSPQASFKPGDELALIEQAWDTLHEKYVAADELNDRDLAYGAIDGMTEAIGDTGHTEFMTPEERKARNDALQGSYVGIGAEVDTAPDGLPMIVGVFRGSPAEKAGLHAGDVVLTVDGRTTVGETLDTTVSWVRGERGTTVVLTVRNGADGPVRTVKVVRDDVHIEPVSWAMIPGTQTAMLRLEQFSSGASKDLHDALEQINKAGAERLVFDLRGNPGGYVNEAVAIASEFLPSGTVYQERNAEGETKATEVKPGGIATEIPMVVLVDEGTASAAEIVSGAIQDAGRAQLVGAKTFGTGTVLGEFELADGSALRIGTVEWLTPKGRVIWHEGIEPDIAVARPAETDPIVPDDLGSMSAAQAKSIADPQLARALQLITGTES
ncbi:MAG TPA: S41 family peptidase [Candidatus Limnocylindrales bacterium]|nr:S41 family peptidase [Candidatus Limnocylindrales bacterium]